MIRYITRHGPSGNMLPLDNTEAGHFCSFDADFGAYFFCLSEGKYFHIPIPAGFPSPAPAETL